MRNNTLISDFYCTQCGNKAIPIPRKKGRQREPGHLKKLYCLKCGKETNHVEIRPIGKYSYNDFLIEFQEGNFTQEGKRKLTWKQCVAAAQYEEHEDTIRRKEGDKECQEL